MLALVLAFGLVVSRPTGISLRVPQVAAVADEWTGWSDALLAALRAKDAAAFDRLIDVDELFKRAAHGVNADVRKAEMYWMGVRQTMVNGRGFYAEFARMIELGARFELLRHRTRNGARTALYRCVHVDTGLAYFEFRLERTPEGHVRATDVYLCSAGENYSTTLRAWFVFFSQHWKVEAGERPDDAQRLQMKHFEEIKALLTAAQARDWTAFKAIHGKLPDELRRDRKIVVMRFKACPAGDPCHLAALDDLIRHSIDEMSTALHSIDAHWFRGDHERAITSIERLNRLVGGDPYLDYKRASALVDEGELGHAAVAAREAIDGGWSGLDAYDGLLMIYLRLRSFQEALSLMKETDRAHRVTWGDFTTLPAFAGFVKSPQYAQWLEYLKSKAAAKK